MCGKGVMIRASGEKIEGLWNDNVLEKCAI